MPATVIFIEHYGELRKKKQYAVSRVCHSERSEETAGINKGICMQAVSSFLGMTELS
jgi:hypothetical protein